MGRNGSGWVTDSACKEELLSLPSGGSNLVRCSVFL